MARHLADRILEYLDAHDETNSLDLADEFQENHQKIVGAIKSLETVDDVSLFRQWKFLLRASYVSNCFCMCDDARCVSRRQIIIFFSPMWRKKDER